MQISFLWPPVALDNAQVRRQMRDVIGGRMRRRLDKLAADLAAETQQAGYERIAQAYRVVQHSDGDTLSFAIVNDDDKWIWSEVDTRPHMPPTREGSDLWLWAQGRGVDVWPVAMKIAREGTKGTHIFQTLWEDAEDEVMDVAAQGYEAVLERVWSS